jgi:sugar lactone lactonase YvrE
MLNSASAQVRTALGFVLAHSLYVLCFAVLRDSWLVMAMGVEAKMTGIEVVLDAKAIIGESPTWSPTEAVLYWIDVKAPALYRFDHATGEHRRWPVTGDVGAFTLLPDLSGAVIALRTGIYDLRFSDDSLTLRAKPPFNPALFRFNEGGCDPSGRFWVGVMFDPIEPTSAAQQGFLCSYSRPDGLKLEPDTAELHNGMAWSEDGGYMYLSHSQEGAIYRFELHSGHLANRKRFAMIPQDDGIPDGAALDTEGGYWCALHGGSRLRRFRSDGTPDRDIALPVSQPTMCAFAGADLETLYVTSASDKLSDTQIREEKVAGAVLRMRPGQRGIKRRCTII